MTSLDNWIIMGVGGYLLVGYLIYRWVDMMVNKRWRKDYTDDDRDQIDQTGSLVSVMIAWPKILFPPLWWFVSRVAVGLYIISLSALLRWLQRK